MPTPPTPDVAHEYAQDLLGLLVQRLTDAGSAPTWASVIAGAEPFAPSGDDSMAWVRVGQMYPTEEATQPLGTVQEPTMPQPPGWAIVLEAGVLRCVVVLDDAGNPPTEEELLTEAVQSSVDRRAVLTAVTCDFPAKVDARDGVGLLPGPWNPLSPGAVSGGFMTVTIAVDNIT